MTPMTLTAYAKLRGCSVKSVSLAIKVGRLVGCVGRDQHGRPTIVDAELADREWAANTRQVGVAGPTDARVTAQQPGDRAGVRPDETHAGAQPTMPPVPDYNTSRAVRAAAAARREAALADLAELEVSRKGGRLVDADEAMADFVNHISNAKTRLLAIPSAVGQRFPDLASSVVPVVEELVRAALEELAIDGRRG